MTTKHLLLAVTLFYILVSKTTNAQDPNFHIYLCFGQSNMAGAGDIEAQDKTVDSRFQFMKPQDCPAENEYAGNWYDAVPPLWGCSGGIGPSDYFGRTMIENLPSNVKVGVVVVAVPGCKIELFGKTGYAGYDTYNYVPSKYNGSAYAWLLDLAKKAQKDGVIKGFLLHQGESNSGDQQWPTKVKGVYDNLIADLGLNASKTPLLSGELLYQNQGGVCWGHNSIIATLPSVIPNSYVISAKDLPGKDDFHFTSAGNRTFGVRYAQKMLSISPIGSTVSFTEPTITAFVAPAIVPFDVIVSGDNIEHIDFFINNQTTPFHEEWVAPYNFTYEFPDTGIYKIKAIVFDTDGNSSEDVITIKINIPQAPFNNLINEIPGTIQFENFDIGGNGFAYYDVDKGTNVPTPPDFRTNEDVDIEPCSDTDGGYNIGYAVEGEWLEYTVDVKSAGIYNIVIRAASNGEGRTVSLSMDDLDLATAISIPDTKGWQIWNDVLIENIQLNAGKQVLKLTIGNTNYVNLNYIKFNLISGFEPQIIYLTKGWNLIGCPLKNNPEIQIALKSIWDNVEIIKNNESFYAKMQPEPFNLLKTLNWGTGYMIKVNSDCELKWDK